MSDEQMECPQKNSVFSALNLDGVDSVCDYLLGSGVLTPSMVEMIKAEKTSVEKARALSIIMRMRGVEAFDKYYKAVKGSANKALAKRLKSYLSANLPKLSKAPKGKSAAGKDRVVAEQAQGGSAELSRGQHVFISYQHFYQPTVLRVRDRLNRAGYKVWMDVDDMGENLLESISNAVENSSVILMFVSQQYKESTICQLEAEYASNLKKPIIPVVIQSDYKAGGWLGLLMGAKKYYSFTKPGEVDTNMSPLMEGINTIIKLE